MGLLQHVITARSPQPPKGIIYGPAGIGKTTFGASATAAIIIDCENGAGNIGDACQRTPYLSDWDGIRAWLLALETEEHPYRTVVIDSLDWMLRRVEESVTGAKKGAMENTLNKAHGGYGNGRSVMKNYVFQQLLPNLDRIVCRGIAVVLLAHASRREVMDADGVSVEKTTFESPDDYVPIFTEWADFVCLARKDSKTGERVLITEESDCHLAKNRYNLPPVIPFTWQAFRESIRAGMNTGTKQTENQKGNE